MAMSVVSSVVEKLGVALIEEVIFLKGVREQFERLQKELISIKGALKTADAQHCEDPDICTWVADIRDIAYDVDDIMDAFFLKVAKEESGSNNVLKRYTRMPKNMVKVHKIGKEMETIFTKIEDISNRRRRYGITNLTEKEGTSSSTTVDQVRLRRSRPHAKDDDIIGLEEETNILVAQLKKEDELRRVVSICGMGGLGKTTLAKKVYNRKDVKAHFGRHAWTFISQQCRPQDVFQEILRQVSTHSNKEIEKMKEVELEEKLFSILEKHRYLVVLDDIWSKEAWDMLKFTFPNGKKGSKVMLTTRNMEVALHADPWSLHFEPRALNDDEAWDLICKKSFPKDVIGMSWSSSSDLEKCGREMAKKCGGLPLAIVVLGGILATKKSLNEWETVLKNIAQFMSKGQAGIFAILALSYNDLPYHLKPLFLYLGLFPEDYHISVKALIRMWIAESLFSQKQGSQLSMEDMGKQYLDELIHRCMVQIGKRNIEGRVKTCQLHDAMRELCLAKSREENFLQIIGKNVSSEDFPSSSSVTTKLRRCTIYLGDDRYEFSHNLIPCLRTVFFVSAATFNNATCPKILYGNFKLVKVLELQGVLLHAKTLGVEFCKEIGKLINLRYLGLRNTRLIKLPKSIGNLVFLQTLDVRICTYNFQWHDLPNMIWKMEQLRHFYIDHSCPNSDLLRMDTLRNLRTLRGIRAGSWIADLVKFTNLEKLDMQCLTTEMCKVVVESIVYGLDNLRSLTLCMSILEPFSDLERLSQKCHILRLRLQGEIEIFPSQWPSKIITLKLGGSQLNQDPMPILENLQHLTYLGLGPGSYKGKEMVCSSKRFPQLQCLKMESLWQLGEWRVEKGAMPRLTSVMIWNCGNLMMIPKGFRFVSTLQKLDIENMPAKFDERVKEGGEDWYTVQHIPSITIR